MLYLCYLAPNIWSCLWFLRSSEDLDKLGCIQSAFVFSAYCDIKWFAPDYTLCEKKNTQNRQNSDLWPMTRCPQRWNNKLHWTKEQCIKGAFPHMYALMGHASEFDEKFWTYILIKSSFGRALSQFFFNISLLKMPQSLSETVRYDPIWQISS